MDLLIKFEKIILRTKWSCRMERVKVMTTKKFAPTFHCSELASRQAGEATFNYIMAVATTKNRQKEGKMCVHPVQREPCGQGNLLHLTQQNFPQFFFPPQNFPPPSTFFCVRKVRPFQLCVSAADKQF